MARIYANENFPRQVVERLRQLGHDVLTTQEAGNAGQAIADPNVLAFAIRDDRAVLTLNRRDFIRLHRSSQEHAGIIVCSEELDVEAQAARIDAAIVQAGSLRAQLLRVNRPHR